MRGQKRATGRKLTSTYGVRLTPEADRQLDELAEYLRQHPEALAGRKRRGPSAPGRGDALRLAISTLHDLLLIK